MYQSRAHSTVAFVRVFFIVQLPLVLFYLVLHFLVFLPLCLPFLVLLILFFLHLLIILYPIPCLPFLPLLFIVLSARFPSGSPSRGRESLISCTKGAKYALCALHDNGAGIRCRLQVAACMQATFQLSSLVAAAGQQHQSFLR